MRTIFLVLMIRIFKKKSTYILVNLLLFSALLNKKNTENDAKMLNQSAFFDVTKTQRSSNLIQHKYCTFPKTIMKFNKT